MDAVCLIRRLHQHRDWVNRKLLAAATVLDDAHLRKPYAIGQGSIWNTLVHLFAAEYVWLEALLGNEDPVAPGDLPSRLPGNQLGEGGVTGPEDLRRRWAELRELRRIGRSTRRRTCSWSLEVHCVTAWPPVSFEIRPRASVPSTGATRDSTHRGVGPKQVTARGTARRPGDGDAPDRLTHTRPGLGRWARQPGGRGGLCRLDRSRASARGAITVHKNTQLLIVASPLVGRGRACD
jgi:hypothetical protein